MNRKMWPILVILILNVVSMEVAFMDATFTHTMIAIVVFMCAA